MRSTPEDPKNATYVSMPAARVSPDDPGLLPLEMTAYQPVEASLLLTFPHAAARRAAGALADLLVCLDGLHLAAISLTIDADPPSWLTSHTVQADGTVVRERLFETLTVVKCRYGSTLELLLTGGGAGALTTTVLALMVKPDEIATRLFTIPDRIRARRAQLQAEIAHAQRDKALADRERAGLDRETRQFWRDHLIRAEADDLERVAVEQAAHQQLDEAPVRLEPQWALAPGPGGEPGRPGDQEVTQITQLQKRVRQVAGSVEAQLELPTTGTI